MNNIIPIKSQWRERTAQYIYDRAVEKLKNYEDVADEVQYLSLLDEKLCSELNAEYMIIKSTTRYAQKTLKHKITILLRTLVG